MSLSFSLPHLQKIAFVQMTMQMTTPLCFAGDGNCMFRAAADQLFANDERHMEVRAIATQYLSLSLLSTWPPSFKTLNRKKMSGACCTLSVASRWKDFGLICWRPSMIFPQMQYLSSCLPETSEFNQELTIALVQVRQAVVDYMLENEEDFVYFLAPATRPAYKKVG
jgi:hypothetical protein